MSLSNNSSCLEAEKEAEEEAWHASINQPEQHQQQKEGLDLSIISPLDQFEIRDLLSLDAPILANLHLSITNIGLYLTITAAICLALNFLATNYNKVTANN